MVNGLKQKRVVARHLVSRRLMENLKGTGKEREPRRNFYVCNTGNWGCAVKVKVAQLCPTLCNPMDYTVHGILQARILEWVAFPFSRGSSQPRIEPRSPALQADSLPAEPQGKPQMCCGRLQRSRGKGLERKIMNFCTRVCGASRHTGGDILF